MAAAGKKESGYMVPELRRERERSTLNLEEMITFLDGGEHIREKKDRMCRWREGERGGEGRGGVRGMNGLSYLSLALV